MSSPRDRLLDTAARLFTERGYEAVGINEIIAKAEVAKASFYQHFPSKQDLCAAWLREEAARSEQRFREVLTSETPLRRRIAAQFDELACWVEGNCFRGCPFSITAAMTETGKECRDLIRDHAEVSRRFWQKLARQSGISAARARDLGDAWLLLHSGAFTQAQNTGSTWPIEQARKVALSLLKTSSAKA